MKIYFGCVQPDDLPSSEDDAESVCDDESDITTTELEELRNEANSILHRTIKELAEAKAEEKKLEKEIASLQVMRSNFIFPLAIKKIEPFEGFIFRLHCFLALFANFAAITFYSKTYEDDKNIYKILEIQNSLK